MLRVATEAAGREAFVQLPIWGSYVDHGRNPARNPVREAMVSLIIERGYRMLAHFCSPELKDSIPGAGGPRAPRAVKFGIRD
jgi:hypothetical protein